MQNFEVMEVALANRAFLYQYLWRLFASEPDQNLIEVICSGEPDEQCSLFLNSGHESLNQKCFYSEISDCVKSHLDEGVLDVMRDEYVRLFVGPAALPSPPWESVFVGKEDVLFQQSTLDVRYDYNVAGFKTQGYPHEADDHIACELSFMQHLSAQSLDALKSGDYAKVTSLLEKQKSFLTKHLCVWLPDFASRLESTCEKLRRETSAIYISAAFLASEICKEDSLVLLDLIALSNQLG